MNYLIILIDVYTNGFNTYYLEIFSFIAIICSILVISSKNPVVSVLFLIALFLTISLYLILVGLTFIGLSYLLVYIGAVSMLFLFILMLIDIRVSELQIETSNGLLLAFLLGSLFYFTSSNLVLSDTFNTSDISNIVFAN
jgi:NADH-ubiquinone oxidoreductase chain 6